MVLDVLNLGDSVLKVEPLSSDEASFDLRVDKTVRVLFDLVAESVGWATAAFLDQDVPAANRVITGEKNFDARCDELTALVKARLSSSKVALGELENLVALLQIIPELERSADLAEHIAQRSLQGLGGVIPPLTRGLVQSIADLTIEMWRRVGEAFATRSRDVDLALDESDSELDELCASLVGEGMGGIQDPRLAVDLALIARFYERLGDHAVNLARRVATMSAPKRLTPLSSLMAPSGQGRKMGLSRLTSRLRRLRLAPGDERFFELFEKAAANTLRCAVELRKLVVSFTDVDDHYQVIRGYERRGDEVTMELLRLLDASFVTPYDREDIHALVEELDDVVDEMFSAASLIQLLKVDGSLSELVELAELLVTMSEEVAALIERLRSRDGARYHLERIEQLEHHGDAIYRKAIERLFGGEYDAIEILKWKDIVQAFENSANAIEDVSDVVESILVKAM